MLKIENFTKKYGDCVAVVVKQSKSVMISMFVNMILTLIPIGIFIALVGEGLSLLMFMTVVLSVFVLIDVVLTVLFLKKSTMLYRKLS